MKQYFGIDIGGTAVKLGIVDETGRVLLKGEESVSFDGYQTPVLTTVRRAAKEFLTANSIPVESLAGIGVSATGQIDSRKGIVAGTCGNFPNYIGSPIKAALEKDFGLPVTVANDANCMTLGEVWVGGAKGYTDVIGVTLGTGVGGGILTGGRRLEDFDAVHHHITVLHIDMVPGIFGHAFDVLIDSVRRCRVVCRSDDRLDAAWRAFPVFIPEHRHGCRQCLCGRNRRHRGS